MKGAASAEGRGPEIAPVSPHGNRPDLIEGKAVGPVEDDVEWAVEEIVPPGSPEMRLTFVSEDAARSHWHANGGQLLRTTCTSWTLAPDWRDRASRANS